jgi:hypothetical protein
MTKIEIGQEAADKLQQLSNKSQKSVDEILIWLLDHYAQAIVHEEDVAVADDQTWTDEELAELLTPKEPLTGKQIVEKGLLGAWKDMGIEDSVEWLAQQRAKRRRKFQW